MFHFVPQKRRQDGIHCMLSQRPPSVILGAWNVLYRSKQNCQLATIVLNFIEGSLNFIEGTHSFSWHRVIHMTKCHCHAFYIDTTLNFLCLSVFNGPISQSILVWKTQFWSGSSLNINNHANETKYTNIPFGWMSKTSKCSTRIIISELVVQIVVLSHWWVWDWSWPVYMCFLLLWSHSGVWDLSWPEGVSGEGLKTPTWRVGNKIDHRPDIRKIERQQRGVAIRKEYWQHRQNICETKRSAQKYQNGSFLHFFV